MEMYVEYLTNFQHSKQLNDNDHKVHHGCLILYQDIRGLVVVIVIFKSLALHRCMFESNGGCRIVPCGEAVQLTFGRSMVLSGSPSVLKIHLWGVTGVLHQY